MPERELDINASQLVHWLKSEKTTSGGKNFEIRATREYVVEPIPDPEEAGFSAEAELASVTVIGTLEIKSVQAQYPWLLRVRIEDVVGPRAPIDEDDPEEPEEINMDAFDEEFIRPDRGAVFVSLETKTEQAEEDFNLLFADLLRDRHRR